MRRWTAALFVALSVSVLALPAAAQWKWRDKNGQIQYSDMPPPAGVADKDVLARPAAAQRLAPAPSASTAASAASSASGAKAVEPELEAKRKQAEQAEADKRKAEEAKVAAVKADNCQRARADLRTLDSGQRMARINAKGEREIIDDATRAAETRRAQDAISGNCQ